MREGWEYKKLGEVAKISSGKAIPSSDIIVTFSEGLYPCYGGNGLRGYVDHFSNDGLVPVIGRVGALCGNVHLPQGKFYATEHALVVYLKTKDKPHYIEYLLSSLNLRQYAKGVAQPVLSASTLSDILIPVPPLSEQERIVSELDLLSSIIEKKKAQLKEYDQLAQSIFYDMFGDPVTNEKGWEVKKLGEITTQITDGSHNPPKGIDKSEYPMLSSKNVFFGYYDYDSPRYLSKEEFEIENKRTNISDGDVLLTIVGTIGRACCVQEPFVPFTLQRSVAVLKPKKEIIFPLMLMFSLHLLSDFWNNEAKGVAQKGIYLKQLAKVSIPLPPLTLQQSFAEKIEAIEKQKELIKQSIAETETLFNSRMDYYFN